MGTRSLSIFFSYWTSKVYLLWADTANLLKTEAVFFSKHSSLPQLPYVSYSSSHTVGVFHNWCHTFLPFYPGISHLPVFKADPAVYCWSSECPQSNTGDHTYSLMATSFQTRWRKYIVKINILKKHFGVTKASRWSGRLFRKKHSRDNFPVGRDEDFLALERKGHQRKNSKKRNKMNKKQQEGGIFVWLFPNWNYLPLPPVWIQ